LSPSPPSRSRGSVLGISLVVALMLLASCSLAHAGPLAAQSASVAHRPNWPALIAVGPVVTLVGAAISAVILMLAVLARRETALYSFADACAERLDLSRTGLFFWGLAELIAILFIGFNLLKVHGAGLLGMAVLLAGMALCAFAIAVAALVIERKCTEYAHTDLRLPGAGIVILIFGSAVPIVGWLVSGVFALASLGAVSEVLVTSRRRKLPAGQHPSSGEISKIA
jgi:hypothetical protein